MKYFIDCEFLEGIQANKPSILMFGKKHKPTIDLISIGIVCEDDRELYIISKDFNLKEAWNRYDLKPDNQKIYWIRENVLKPIWKDFSNRYINTHTFPDIHYEFSYGSLKELIQLYGETNKQIAEDIIEFCTVNEFSGNGILDQVENFKSKINKNIEFYGYYSDYDWVCFCWLFGKMIDLPKGFPMYCNDLKQTLDEKEFLLQFSSKHYAIKSIEKLSNYPKQTNEHNALSDAKWNFELYKFLKTI